MFFCSSSSWMFTLLGHRYCWYFRLQFTPIIFVSRGVSWIVVTGGTKVLFINSICCKCYTWPLCVGFAYLNYQALFPHKEPKYRVSLNLGIRSLNKHAQGTGSNWFPDIMKIKGETQLYLLHAPPLPPLQLRSFPSKFYISMPDSWNQ